MADQRQMRLPCVHRELRKALPGLAQWEIDEAFKEIVAGDLVRLPYDECHFYGLEPMAVKQIRDERAAMVALWPGLGEDAQPGARERP